MAVKITYSAAADKIEETLSCVLKPTIEKMDIPDSTLTVTELMPLIIALRDLIRLAGKLDKTTTELGLRVTASEGEQASKTAKPSSDFATNLDHRLTATSDLLRAALDRLDQVEAATIRLYKTPFLAIASNDKPRKELDALKASFNVACAKPS